MLTKPLALELSPRAHMLHAQPQLPIQPQQATPCSHNLPISQTTMAMPRNLLSWRGRKPDTTNRVVDLAQLPPGLYPSLWEDNGCGGPNMTHRVVDFAQLPPDQGPASWCQIVRDSNINMMEELPSPATWSFIAGSSSILVLNPAIVR